MYVSWETLGELLNKIEDRVAHVSRAIVVPFPVLSRKGGEKGLGTTACTHTDYFPQNTPHAFSNEYTENVHRWSMRRDICILPGYGQQNCHICLNTVVGTVLLASVNDG